MKKNIKIILIMAVFSLLTVWWAWANITGNTDQKELFSDSYWILPLISGIIGLVAAKSWGGLKSTLGKAVTFLSVGLFAQVFGQVVYTYYAYVQHIEAPYPSIGDIGFFGAVIAYILGAYYLSKTVATRLSRSKPLARLASITVPLVILAVSYYIFLKDYEYDSSHLLTTALDFGYPLGQAVYLAIAILAYFFSRNILGGVMRSKILLVLIALVLQYCADFLFLFRFSRDLYVAGGFTDFVYLTAYLAMGVALISLVDAYGSLRTTKQPVDSEVSNES